MFLGFPAFFLLGLTAYHLMLVRCTGFYRVFTDFSRVLTGFN